jgi:hypothetical protein
MHLPQDPHCTHGQRQRWSMSMSKVEDSHQGILIRLFYLLFDRRLVTSVVDIVVHPDIIGHKTALSFPPC